MGGRVRRDPDCRCYDHDHDALFGEDPTVAKYGLADVTDDAVDDETIERILAAALRAPSAGYSQGYSLVVLRDGADRARFWASQGPTEGGGWEPAVREAIQRAPVIVVALASKDAYLDRYARADKGWSDRDEARWPVPSPMWLPRTQERVVVPLVGGRVVMSGVVDLAFGSPAAERASAARRRGRGV